MLFMWCHYFIKEPPVKGYEGNKFYIYKRHKTARSYVKAYDSGAVYFHLNVRREL